MRCSSTVSAPVQHCCAPLTAHHSRYIAVQLLTNQILYFVTETKSKAKDVYAQTCIYLAGQGMLSCELFGLAIMCDGEYLFVDPESKLSKYAPKNWKSSSSHGLDGQGKPVFVLHFRVQFYVETILFLRDDITRHNYYLQLRDNVVSRGQIPFCSGDELLLLLAGYALQADHGDYNEIEHKGTYFPLEKYFPKEIITRNSQIFKTAVALHKRNSGLSPAEAETQYIKEASSNEISLLTHNVHLYKLKSHKKQEMNQCTVWLAICPQGIQIYEETNLRKSLSTTLQWNNIGKLCFDRKKFEINASTAEKMTYYTNSDDKSKHLLFLCRETHQFSMSVQSKLLDIRKEEEEKKKYKESFVYELGNASNFRSSFVRMNYNSLHYKNLRSDQRISVISNTSSNTTSGIVSDRVQSLDESEDDIEIGLRLNSSAANSGESLALAHLNDGPVKNENLNETTLCKSDELSGTVQCTNYQIQKPSPSLGREITATTATDSSQCSSSCSTVVNGVDVKLNLPSLIQQPLRNGIATTALEVDDSNHANLDSIVCNAVPCNEVDSSIQTPQFGISDKSNCENSEEVHIFSLKPMTELQDVLPNSNLIYNSIDQAKTNSNIAIKDSLIDDKILKSSLFANSNFQNSDLYESNFRLDIENTQQNEMDYSDKIVSHISNISDLETNSSGIYTNSNDVNSIRIHSSADLETSNSEIFTLHNGGEPDLQTNACSSETSGIYGISNSLADTSSASECFGLYAITESIRQRSESNASEISVTESFHGDGSDPSEAGKGALLTAKELSDLIVGQSHNSGSYPSRATVSSTLDSDSDYVTLPPPPSVLSQTPFIKDNLNVNAAKSFSGDQNCLNFENAKQTVSSKNSNASNFSALRKFFTNSVGQLINENNHSCASQLHEPMLSQKCKNSSVCEPTDLRKTLTLPSPAGEANARLITTKPHISMITHSNVPSLSFSPKYASPPSQPCYYLSSRDAGKNRTEYSLCPQKIKNQNYEVGYRLETPPYDRNNVAWSQKSHLENLKNIGSYNANGLSKDSMSLKKYSNKYDRYDSGEDLKSGSVSVLPIIKKNNYLDVHASKAKTYMPVKSVSYHPNFLPLSHRQSLHSSSSLATVYTSQVTRSQVEQFKQQLYSDVDYVIYPMKDPAISKQEYIDAKHGSILAALAAEYPNMCCRRRRRPPPPPPPPYSLAKTQTVYRSTPNVALENNYMPLNITSQPALSKYSSNCHINQFSEKLLGYQSYLSQTSHYPSSSLLYSPSYSSSSLQSLRYEPKQITEYVIPHSLSSIPGNSLNVSRTRSDDNIFSSCQKQKAVYPESKPPQYLPPPPTLPSHTLTKTKPKTQKNLSSKPECNITTFSKAQEFKKPAFHTTGIEDGKIRADSKKIKNTKQDSLHYLSQTVDDDDKKKMIDIHALIEQSKNLDLPLISALCNDKSLIRQTNAFVMPKHPGSEQSTSNHGIKNVKTVSKKSTEKEPSYHVGCKNNQSTSQKLHKTTADLSANSSTKITNFNKANKSTTLLETIFSVKSPKKCVSSSKLKYPVSGLSTTQISKPQKKLSSAHVHPLISKPDNSNVSRAVKSQTKTSVPSNKTTP